MIRVIRNLYLPKPEKKLPKYLLYVDYMTEHSNSCEYIRLKSKDIISAMDEADRVSRVERSNIYLLRIMELTDKRKAYSTPIWYGDYKAVLASRSTIGNWHTNTEANGECLHTIDGIDNDDICTYIEE